MLSKINWVTVVNTAILLFAGVLIFAVVQSMRHPQALTKQSEQLPYYSTADAKLRRAGGDLYHSLQCRNCHTIWSVKSIYETVPAPSLDGIGSLRDEAWLYKYFSAKNPQEMLPSRLKKQYRHPSYADLPEDQRKLLARYFASLKVRDWYLKETRQAEKERLTGQD